jgi:hypothetical protein
MNNKENAASTEFESAAAHKIRQHRTQSCNLLADLETGKVWRRQTFISLLFLDEMGNDFQSAEAARCGSGA